jgi:hypothetical protein
MLGAEKNSGCKARKLVGRKRKLKGKIIEGGDDKSECNSFQQSTEDDITEGEQ